MWHPTLVTTNLIYTPCKKSKSSLLNKACFLRKAHAHHKFFVALGLWNSQCSQDGPLTLDWPCLCLPSAEIPDMCHPTQLPHRQLDMMLACTGTRLVWKQKPGYCPQKPLVTQSSLSRYCVTLLSSLSYHSSYAGPLCFKNILSLTEASHGVLWPTNHLCATGIQEQSLWPIGSEVFFCQ